MGDVSQLLPFILPSGPGIESPVDYLSGGPWRLELLTQSYQQWFFESWLPAIADAIAAVRLQGPDADLGAVAEMISTARTTSQSLRNAVNSLRLKVRPSDASCEGGELWHAWSCSLDEASGLFHDVNNIMACYEMAYSLRSGRPDSPQARAALERLQEYDITSLRSIVGMAVRLHASRLGGQHLEIEAGEIPPINIPAEQRVDLIRIISELLTNALRHADPEKPRPLVRVEALMDEGAVSVAVADNGIGIRDVGAVLGSGVREQGLGSGSGLQTIKGIAAFQGWTFELHSMPGTGTRAAVKIGVIQQGEGWQSAPSCPPPRISGIREIGGEGREHSTSGGAWISGQSCVALPPGLRPLRSSLLALFAALPVSVLRR